MSTATEAMEIVDQLVKARMPKQTAKKLIDYMDRQQGELATKQDIKDMATKQEIKHLSKGQDRLWLVMLGGFAIMITIMLYLHSDTKAETRRRFEDARAETNRRFEETKAEIRELKTDMKEIKELLQGKK